MEDDVKTRLGRAVIKVLRPLLRVMIRHEITVPDFTELVRQAYVDVAYEHFGIEGRKLTYARVAVLTGLHRKEVVRLSALRGDAGRLSRPTPNRAQRVVNGWLSDAEFLTARGRPRVLTLHGERDSFAALVARYSGDITLGAVLDELLRVGLVSRDARDRIRLERLGYVPEDDELEKVRVMAVCAADLLGTAVHNIEKGDADPKFQRQLVYPDVEPAVARAFRERSATLSAEYLQQLNRLLAELRAEAADGAAVGAVDGAADRAADGTGSGAGVPGATGTAGAHAPGGIGRRTGFGLYYFDEHPEDDDAGKP